ncbi:Prefoldin [Bisporella sp. PMI_857]|nr:Prefoldin [Bisporella sp. PMI_857]
MSIPNEALQKLVQEIESQAAAAQQQINVVRSQISGKQREIRMLQLTSEEVSTLPSDTNVYEGVGKMFVYSPIEGVDKRLKDETSELKSDVDNLGKKLLYLETTHKNSREHIDQIFKSGGRA